MMHWYVTFGTRPPRQPPPPPAPPAAAAAAGAPRDKHKLATMELVSTMALAPCMALGSDGVAPAAAHGAHSLGACLIEARRPTGCAKGTRLSANLPASLDRV